MKIGIIGTGNVAKSIGEALSKSNEVVYGSRKPEEAKQKMPNANVQSIEEAASNILFRKSMMRRVFQGCFLAVLHLYQQWLFLSMLSEKYLTDWLSI